MAHPFTQLQAGLQYLPGFLGRSAQENLVEILRDAVKKAPLFTPCMPRTGKPFSVRMTNLGPLGWVADRDGYRYQPCHPDTGAPWPPLPDELTGLWRNVTGRADTPEACLVNVYNDNARMGLHQDMDEADQTAPVVSISLGNTALFRFGGTSRTDRTRSIKLQSGDVVVLGGASRLAFHGVDRIYPGTSTLLVNGGRLNITLRRVSAPT